MFVYTYAYISDPQTVLNLHINPNYTHLSNFDYLLRLKLVSQKQYTFFKNLNKRLSLKNYKN